jgi:allantoinase
LKERKIYSNNVWVDEKLQPATIVFSNGKINTIFFEKDDDAADFGNSIIMPGVVDVHVHINEPGRTEWEGFETATQAAAAGGTTTIVDMPLNASPVTTTVEAFQQKLDASKNQLHVNCGFYAGLIPNNVNDLEALLQSGVLGIKCFLTHSGIDDFPNVTRDELEIAMPIIAKYNLPLLVHAELSDEVVCDFENHPTSYQHYVASRPKKWENDAIEMMIDLCRKHKCQVHIVHVSSAEALEMIASAKQEGLPITAETCAQYLFFNAETIPDAKTIFKCAPPIREKENNHQLKQALVNGTLDFITTDHSPAPASLKEIESGNLQKAWGGIAGIQFLLSGSWTALQNEMTIEQFIPLVTSQPAKFIQAKNKGELKVGYDADIVIWNHSESKLIEEKDIYFKHKISPYIGKTLNGVVIETIVNGETVFANHQIKNKNKGIWLLKK